MATIETNLSQAGLSNLYALIASETQYWDAVAEELADTVEEDLADYAVAVAPHAEKPGFYVATIPAGLPAASAPYWIEFRQRSGAGGTETWTDKVFAADPLHWDGDNEVGLSLLTTIDANTEVIGTPANGTIAADVAENQTDLNTLLGRIAAAIAIDGSGNVGANLQLWKGSTPNNLGSGLVLARAEGGPLGAGLPIATQAQVTDLSGRLPATLTGGRMRSHAEAMDNNVITGDRVADSAVTKITDGLATSAEVLAIQNLGARYRAVVPTVVERPDTGTQDYLLLFLHNDRDGALAHVDDEEVTITVLHPDGTEFVAPTLMTVDAVGVYSFVLEIASTVDLGQLLIRFSGEVDAQAFLFPSSTTVVDTTQVGFSASDRSQLQTLHDERVTTDERARIDVSISSRAAPQDKMDIVDAPNATAVAAFQQGLSEFDASTDTVKLASDGLDNLDQTPASGQATTLVGKIVALYRRFYGKVTIDATEGSGELKTYANDGTTVLTTQAISDDGSSQEQGAAT